LGLSWRKKQRLGNKNRHSRNGQPPRKPMIGNRLRIVSTDNANL
jgi:hypothetical protein